MTKTTAAHIDPLPPSLMPARSALDIANEHLKRYRARGGRNAEIAAKLGFGANFLSMWKDDANLPLSRVLPFAAAVGLTAPRPEGRRFPLHRAQPMLPYSNTGLTASPWADTASPAAKMLRAALTSRSWCVPHCGHVQVRTSTQCRSPIGAPFILALMAQGHPDGEVSRSNG